jgi:hypothetical protein
MADPQQPMAVAPPVAAPVPPAPVAPVAAAPAANGPATSIPATDGSDHADAFEAAVETGDAKSLKALTTSPNPDVASAAKDKVAVIEKNAPLARHLAPIEVSTPEGRLEIAKTYQTLNSREEAQAKGWSTIKDSPQVGTALLRFVMGDKLGALRQITGGDVKAETEYDDNGNMLVVNRNELGQIDSVFDKDGNMISRQDYAARGGSRALEHTLARKRQEQEQKAYVESYIKDTENQNKASSALNSASVYSKEMSELSKDFKNLSTPNSELLAGFNTSVLNYSSNLGETVGTLTSLASSKGKDLSADQAKSVEAATGSALGAIVKYVGKDQFTINGKETVSASDLAQRTKQTSSSKTIDRSVNQARDNVAQQMRINQAVLDSKTATTDEKKQAEIQNQQLAKFDRYFDLAGMREKIYADNKEKTPSFVQLPTRLPNIADQTSRLRLNAIQGEYASAQMDEFLKWKDDQLKKEREINTKFVPEPGRYEAQWPKQKRFLELEDEYRNKARNILSEKPVIGPNVNPATLSTGAVTGAQANQNETGVPPPKAGGSRADQFKVLPNAPAANNEGFKVRRSK